MKKWPIYKAEEFCFKVTDGTHDSPKPQLEGRRLITSKHLKGNYIDFDSAKLISEADYQKVIARSKVDQWDILFSMIGTIGNIYLERNPIAEYACKNVGIFKFNGDKDKALWMYYWLKSPQVRDYVYAQLRGSTQAYLPLGGLREMPVAVPAIETQRKIAAILSALDDKIELNRRINANLEQQAAAIYSAMFTENDSLKTTSGVLSDIAVVTMGQSPKGDSYNEDGVGEVFYQGRAEFGFRFPTRRLFTTEPKRIAEKDDVLLSVRAPVGDINVAYERCCIGRGLASIRSKGEDSSYLLYTMFALKPKLELFNGEGTVFGSVNRDALNSTPISIPEISKIKEFETLVSPIDDLIRTNYEETLRLQTLRDALLPRLMSGEIDVDDVKF